MSITIFETLKLTNISESTNKIKYLDGLYVSRY